MRRWYLDDYFRKNRNKMLELVANKMNMNEDYGNTCELFVVKL
jgi:hypothetical protein